MIGNVGSTGSQAWGSTVSGPQNRPPPPDFAKMFSAIDSDGDGTVTEAELGQALQSGSSSEGADDIAALLSSLDADGNGSIAQDEFTSAMENVLGQLQSQVGMGGMPPPPPPPDASELFASWDADGDGSVTGTELSSALSARAEETGRSGPSAEDLLARLDSDGDGALSEAEMAAGFKAGHGGPPPAGAEEGESSGQFIANMLRHYLDSANLGVESTSTGLSVSV